jgi:hypothetical protein
MTRLMWWCADAPTATNATYRDKPSIIIWHFELTGS